MKELPYKLKSLELNLSYNWLGYISGSLKFLAEGLKLPKNLETFRFFLSENNLGKYAENLEWLGEGLKYLPNNLQDLTL